MKGILISVALICALLLFGCAAPSQSQFGAPVQVQTQPANTQTANQSPSPGDSTVKTSQEGEFCGGIAGIPCSSGFDCQLDGNYPDAGGICKKKVFLSGIFPCPAVRTEMCTMEYAPVCGRSGTAPSSYDFENYATACVACSKGSKATHYFQGTCEDNGLVKKALDSTRLYDCPENRSENCNAIYDPVCGRIVDAGDTPVYFRDYGNPCEACSKASNAIGYYTGKCVDRGTAKQNE